MRLPTDAGRPDPPDLVMFRPDDREALRSRLIARAEADDAIVGAAYTGSAADTADTGSADRTEPTRSPAGSGSAVGSGSAAGSGSASGSGSAVGSGSAGGSGSVGSAGGTGGSGGTGSTGGTAGDQWSDTDLVLAVRGDLTAVVERWTRWLHGGEGAVHHWDLPVGEGVIRVFLLPGWLEIDLTFVPEANFGPRGPQWRTIFGNATPQEPFRPPDREGLIGLTWHHALHARICLHRGHWWQAEHWISALRDHIITLACLRLGLPSAYAKGAHLLPEVLTAELEPTLVRALTERELQRALAATLEVLKAELHRSDPATASRLTPMFADLDQPRTRVSGHETGETNEGERPGSQPAPVSDDRSPLAKLVAEQRAVPPTGAGQVPLPPQLDDDGVDAAAELAAMRDEESR
ncbi:hypothetical protein AB0M20_41255 [Actinoplanes sp. NPDC051633]|uniref:hypothetical protein n=1 Tax=Actinoplanes sp. NPDC051633 TaxID=3155670 RepID=UPI0034256CBC